MVERRTRRSQVPAEALDLFLEAQRAILAAGSLAVATKDGRLLASAGPAPGKLVRAALQVSEARDGIARKMANVATWRLRAGSDQVILASRGGRLSHDLGSGVKRILSRER